MPADEPGMTNVTTQWRMVAIHTEVTCLAYINTLSDRLLPPHSSVEPHSFEAQNISKHRQKKKHKIPVL